LFTRPETVKTGRKGGNRGGIQENSLISIPEALTRKKNLVLGGHKKKRSLTTLRGGAKGKGGA